jgi:hypothetical protein
MLVPYVCVVGMVVISVVVYAFESLDPAISALLVWGFVCFSVYDKDDYRLDPDEARLQALVVDWERNGRL